MDRSIEAAGQDAVALWQLALTAKAAGDHATAAAGFAAVRRLRPDWAEPAFEACLSDLQRGDAGATSHLQTLLDRFPDHAPGWEQLGRFLLSAGKAEAALLCLRRADAPGAPASVALLIGSALRALGRTAEARAAFAEACRRDPASVRAPFLHALSSQDLADWPAAAAGYRQALARDPDLVEALVNLGIVLQAVGDREAAKRAYGAALQRRPDSFGRISQALTTASKGELWLDLGRLRRDLGG